jgi:ribokinase
VNEIVVIGSLNMDLVVRVEKMPKIGETIRGGDLLTVPGGKGANQAAAAALLGNKVRLVGRVGKDEFGSALIANLKQFGVVTENILQDETSATGTAMITVDEQGSNFIVISPGANGKVVPDDLIKVEHLIKSAKLLVLQLEIPLSVIECAVQIASHSNIPIILNPSPVMELPKVLLGMIDYLILNEIEASTISGMNVCDLASAEVAGKQILGQGVKHVVVTLGGAGSLLVTHESVNHIPVLKVDVIDTTAAGDAFTGGFATGLIRGFSLVESVRYGNCTGAIAVTRKGAQTSLPSREAVDELFRSARHQ